MADSLTYVKGNNLQEVLKSIDDNFAKTVNQDLYKGDKGDNVKTEEKSLKTDGKLTDTGKEVYETIFGDGAAITDERLKDFPETWSLYPAMPLFFAHHEGERGTFIDYSCMVVATEVENVYTYEKHEVFPTIYYNSATGNYCWKLNGVETSIPTYKTPSEGNNVQLFLIKDVVDDNNNTKLKYWDPMNGAWTASAPKDLVAGDLAYKLGSTTAEVGDSTETVATVELYTYNGSEWIAVSYDEKAAVLIEYDNARMSYIWKTIYDNLGQNYTTDLVAANSFKFPDGDTAGHYISAVNNESRSDLMVQYKNGTKSHAIVLDGYEVYTGMPTIKDNVVTHTVASRLIRKEELYKQVPIGQIYSNGLSSMVSKTGFVCIDRGAQSSNYVRYIYIYDAPQDKCSALNTWVGIGLDQSTSETFEVRYTIDATKSTDQILWMRDKWGNECDYDFIETPTFCLIEYENYDTPKDYRSEGWFRNNIIKNTEMLFCIMVSGGHSVKKLGNVEIYNNTIIDCNPDGSVNFDLHIYQSEQNVFCSNNTFINSAFNINCGYYYYDWHNRTDVPVSTNFATDDTDDTYDVNLSYNYVKNSTINLLLGVHRFFKNEIKDSTIQGIYTIWPAIGSASTLETCALYNAIDASKGGCTYISALMHNDAVTPTSGNWIAQTWALPMYEISYCKFKNFEVAGYMGFLVYNLSTLISGKTHSQVGELLKSLSYLQSLTNCTFYGDQTIFRYSYISNTSPAPYNPYYEIEIDSNDKTKLTTSLELGTYSVVSDVIVNPDLSIYSFTPSNMPNITLFGYAIKTDRGVTYYDIDNIVCTHSSALQIYPASPKFKYPIFASGLSDTGVPYADSSTLCPQVIYFNTTSGISGYKTTKFKAYIASYKQTKNIYDILT